MNSPNFLYENKLWNRGFRFIAGTDEVGRGCFAGPVVAACVVFEKACDVPNNVKINDSKKLTSKQRDVSDKWIRENSEMYGIGEVSASIINKIGIGKATNVAFRKAVSDANRRSKERIEYLLIDAYYIPYIRGIRIRRKAARKDHNLKDKNSRQRAIVNGDGKVMSIAAASIVAKVYRDKLMQKLGNRGIYEKYDWVSNKGYATTNHQKAILKCGITGYHRKQFVDTFLKNRGLKLQ